MISIKRGLDLPIEGAPDTSIIENKVTRSVAIVGFDYVGMKPTMAVKEGDKVAKGQLLFEDKKTPGVKFTAPASGTVAAINRGAQRVFQSLVIDVEGDEKVAFDQYDSAALVSLDRQLVLSNLVESGLWTTLRSRPFNKIPALNEIPKALFINVMDTNPLAFDPMLVVKKHAEAFVAGVDVLSRLSDTVYVCHGVNTSVPKANAANVRMQRFSGPHPAGLTGTHMHFLEPAAINKNVWGINYQDVIAIGQLFTTGELNNQRVIGLTGPQVEKPRLIRTTIGADLNELTVGQLKSGDNRVISGSVLSGRQVDSSNAYLGRYDLQVSVLREGRDRDFMGWLSPGTDRFSVLRIYLSQFSPLKKFNFTTNTNGSVRAMVPIGVYESVMPLDILPTQLLRALIIGDVDTAIQLGALELAEEDLALCTFVCPGKYEFGPILRDNLTTIEKEG